MIRKTSLFLLPVLLAAAASGATVLYSNGTFDDDSVGFLSQIQDGFSTSDSFTLGSPATITEIVVSLLSVSAPASLDWQIGTTTFSSNEGSGTASLSNSEICAASAGCGGDLDNVYSSSFTLSLALGAGTYWLTLDNASLSGLEGWSDDDGGSSTAVTSFDDEPFTPSNTFAIEGTTAAPEPAGFTLCALGLVLLAAVRRLARKNCTERSRSQV